MVLTGNSSQKSPILSHYPANGENAGGNHQPAQRVCLRMYNKTSVIVQKTNRTVGHCGAGVTAIKAWVCESASGGAQVVCGFNVSPIVFVGVHV